MLRPPRRSASRAAFATLAIFAFILGASPGMAETFAYVGNADSNDISVFKMAESGEMTPVQTAAFTGVEKPGSSTPLASLTRRPRSGSSRGGRRWPPIRTASRV